MANPFDSRTTSLPASRGNGHAAPPGLGSAPDRARRPAGPSAKPAAIVFATIAVLFVAGFVADDLSSAHHPAASSSTTAPARAVPGTGGLVAEPAADVLGTLVQSDEPPSDILGALVVPEGSAAIPGSARQQGLGLYDASVDLQVPGTESDVITFVRKELAAGAWHVISSGASGSGYQLIAQHPGSDGYEWEVGLTTSPTTFSSALPGVAVPASGATPLVLRLFAVADAS